MKRFIRENRGIAAVEFALSLPLLLLMFLGGYEYARYMLIHVKMENIAFTISDIITQQTAVTTSQLDGFMTAASQIMEPYDFAGANGGVFVSSISKAVGETQKVAWQYKYNTAIVGHERISAVGAIGDDAVLPGELLLNDGEMVMVAEVYYDYSPTFFGYMLDNSTVYRSSIFKPRLGSLTTPPPN